MPKTSKHLDNTDKATKATGESKSGHLMDGIVAGLPKRVNPAIVDGIVRGIPNIEQLNRYLFLFQTPYYYKISGAMLSDYTPDIVDIVLNVFYNMFHNSNLIQKSSTFGRPINTINLQIYISQ